METFFDFKVSNKKDIFQTIVRFYIGAHTFQKANCYNS